MTKGSLMKVYCIAEYSLWHSAILLTCIKPKLVLKTDFRSFLEWLFYMGFTVYNLSEIKMVQSNRFFFNRLALAGFLYNLNIRVFAFQSLV